MKPAVRIATVVLGMFCMLALTGCPKKSVVQPPQERETAQVEPEAGRAEQATWNLATIHFDFDRSEIRPGDATLLQRNCDQIKAAVAKNQKPGITIEGYCDPVGTAEYNMALGMRRAEAAKTYMVKLGADSRQLSTISYGEEKLVTQDESQFEMNRRCEFKVAK